MFLAHLVEYTSPHAVFAGPRVRLVIPDQTGHSDLDIDKGQSSYHFFLHQRFLQSDKCWKKRRIMMRPIWANLEICENSLPGKNRNP